MFTPSALCTLFASGADQRVRLELYVRNEGTALHDEVEWDLGSPQRLSPGRYASALCRDLQLGFDWFEAIASYVEELLADCRHALRADPSSVPLLPAGAKAVKREDGGSRPALPRLEP